MSNYRISVVNNLEFRLDVALFTGTVGERRLQNALPSTEISVSNESVCAARLQAGADGIPELLVNSVGVGVCTITLTASGGAPVRYTVTVEDSTAGLRWLPKTLEVASSVSGIIDPFPPGSVDGPNSAASGDPFWIQRDMNDDWYVWWDVDTDPGPDIKKSIPVFLSDSEVSQDYKDEVDARARALGY